MLFSTALSKLERHQKTTWEKWSRSLRWQVVVFYSGDWEEDSLNAILAFSARAADFQWEPNYSFNSSSLFVTKLVLPSIWCSLVAVFITYDDEHDVSSQVGCCLYGCSTDGIASHHTWARWWDNLNLILCYDLHLYTYNLRTKFVIGWKSEELQIWAWSRPGHSSTFGHLRPFCLQVVEKILV